MQEIKEEKQELVVNTVKEESTGLLQIVNYDVCLQNAQSICDSFEVKEITNDEELKQAKDFRAKCNKVNDQVGSLRKTTEKDVLGLFKKQSMTIEKLFKNKADEIGVEINKYMDSKKSALNSNIANNLPKINLKLTFEYSEKLLAKVTKFCQDNNINVEEI